jgi:putative lipoic acid-binding regulatory protein
LGLLHGRELGRRDTARLHPNSRDEDETQHKPSSRGSDHSATIAFSDLSTEQYSPRVFN